MEKISISKNLTANDHLNILLCIARLNGIKWKNDGSLVDAVFHLFMMPNFSNFNSLFTEEDVKLAISENEILNWEMSKLHNSEDLDMVFLELIEKLGLVECVKSAGNMIDQVTIEISKAKQELVRYFVLGYDNDDIDDEVKYDMLSELCDKIPVKYYNRVEKFLSFLSNYINTNLLDKEDIYKDFLNIVTTLQGHLPKKDLDEVVEFLDSQRSTIGNSETFDTSTVSSNDKEIEMSKEDACKLLEEYRGIDESLVNAYSKAVCFIADCKNITDKLTLESSQLLDVTIGNPNYYYSVGDEFTINHPGETEAYKVCLYTDGRTIDMGENDNSSTLAVEGATYVVEVESINRCINKVYITTNICDMSFIQSLYGQVMSGFLHGYHTDSPKGLYYRATLQ